MIRLSQFTFMIATVALATALSAAGCGTDSTSSTAAKDGTAATDAGATDGGADTATVADAGADTTAAKSDADSADTGSTDAGSTDAGSADANVQPSKYNDFASALSLTLGGDATKESLSPTGESDYFKFEGKKGDAMIIAVAAQEKAFDTDALDTVITLFDADKKQVALNDDPTPRSTNDSSIYIILPKDGTYYVVVQECWTWIASKKIDASCAKPKDKTKTDYSIFAGTLNTALAWIVRDAEKGDTAADASTLAYKKNTAGTLYNTAKIFGLFNGVSDMDWFSFTMPKDIKIDGDRLLGSFTPFPDGVDGNGSTTSVGMAALYLASSVTQAIASVDMSNKGSTLATPLKAGESYLLALSHPGKTAGSNDFYFLNHRPSTGNPLEQADKTNDVLKTPETMKAGQGASADGTYFFISGDIAPISDVDHFSVAIPAGQENGQVTVACSAQRVGSGLRGLTLTLMTADGTELTGGATAESATIASVLNKVELKGTKTLILRVKADKQDAAVGGTYYRCGVQVLPKK